MLRLARKVHEEGSRPRARDGEQEQVDPGRRNSARQSSNPRVTRPSHSRTAASASAIDAGQDPQRLLPDAAHARREAQVVVSLSASEYARVWGRRYMEAQVSGWISMSK
jgi:hypothetical protein